MQRIAVPDTGSDLQTVARAGAILFAFTPERPEMGLTQLATELGMSKATVHRLAQTLVSLELLEQHPVTRGYRLGVRLLKLAHIVESSLDIRHEARAALRQLRDDTGETVYLMLLRGDAAICAERIEGSHPMRDLSTPPGTLVPLHIGAAGTAIMSALEPAQVEAVLAPLAPAASHKVLARVDAARQGGHALSRSDIAEGVGAIAAPLIDEHGVVVGALSIGGLLQRVEAAEQTLARSVATATARVRASMGWD